MNPIAICRSLAILSLLLLATACGPQGGAAVTKGKNAETDNGSGHIKVPEPVDNRSRLSKVRGLDRRERCIEILDQVLDLKKQHDASSDDSVKARLKKQALDLYEKAGGLYEGLQEDVDAIDRHLWNSEFRGLERKWQKKSRPIKRWAFR